jgi:hypothetical protein
MKLSNNLRPVVIVVLGFSAFIAVSLLFVLLLGQVPTQGEACQRECAAHGKAGILAYKGPPSAKPRNRLYDPFSKCECR